MAGLLMTITDAGLDALVDAEGGGSDDIVIDALGLTSEIFVQAPTLTALPGEFKRLESISGEPVSDNIIHLTAYDVSSDIYDVTGFGLFLDDGTMFASYSSDANPVLSKAELAFALFSQDISFDNSAAANITFGTAIFSYPPASKTKKGVAELADDAEADLGVDDGRIMTPKMVKRRIDAIPSSTEAARGLAEIANNAEADAGTDDARMMTSAKVKRRIDAIPNATEAARGLAEIADNAEADAGVDDGRIMTPAKVKRVLDALSTAVNLALTAITDTINAILDRTISGAGLVTGGGDLSANRTLTVTAALAADFIAGTAANKALTPAALGPLSKLIAQNGYITIPTGDPANTILVQWGRFTAIAKGLTAVNFPISFAECFVAVADGTGETSTSDQDMGTAVRTSTISPTGFSVFSQQSVNDPMNYIAIGRIDLS